MDIFKKSISIFIGFMLIISLVACSSEGSSGNNSNGATEKTLIFADPGWDSARFHNSVAQFILENGYDYSTDIMPGSTPALFTGLENGDVDIYIELWKENSLDLFTRMMDSGHVSEVGLNYGDSIQGIYVPTYVIEGDEERGIDPIAPGLKSVEDLIKYPDLFPDPEDSTKGRIIGSVPSWTATDEIISGKFEGYGLDEHYNLFRPGSEAALNTSIIDAYRAGDPWVGYFWEPTWIAGLYDLTLLEEPEYDEEVWNKNFTTEFPPVNVIVAANKVVEEEHPEVYKFLSNYNTSSALTSEALAYMQDNDANPDEAALYFLKEYEDVWTEWVPEVVAQKVKEALN